MSIKSFLKKIRKQCAIYWSSPSPDGFGGFKFGEPEEIACRWEDVHEVFIDADGEQKVSNCKIFPCKELEVGGYLKLLGSDEELDSSTPSNPVGYPGCYKILKVEKIPDVKNKTKVYIVMV